MAEIEYFYAAHSAYAYLGSSRLMEIAKAAGRTIAHKPYDLRKGIEAAKQPGFRERTANHRDYFFRREIERWSEYRNAPVMQGIPTHHQNEITLPTCMLIACVEAGGDTDALAHGMLESHWRDDADLADADTLAIIARGVGVDPDPLLAAAGTQAIQDIYDANTAEAIERTVFGSPTYFVDGDMFYGQDHLEMAERALTKPFAGKWR